MRDFIAVEVFDWDDGIVSIAQLKAFFWPKM